MKARVDLDFLQTVLGMGKGIQEKFSESLKLINDDDMDAEKALGKTGFWQAFIQELKRES